MVLNMLMMVKMASPGYTLLFFALPTLFVVLNAQNYQVTFTIQEERGPDSFVGDIASSFGSNIPAEENGYINYEFLQQNYIQTLLSLDSTTGILRTGVVIDRESPIVCHTHPICSFTFDVAVRSTRPPSSFFEIVSVTMVIEDINDNSPSFPHSLIMLEVSEAATSGTSFHIDSAVDNDAGIYSVQSYAIERQDGNFTLDVLRKLDGSYTVKLILGEKLDREKKDKYNVMIVAKDGGTPPKFGTVSVNITVTDENDNAPVFTDNNYNITVRENVTVGSTILNIQAIDKDIGENGRVTYRLSENQLDARVTNVFRIMTDNGDLKLKDKLVYESESSYKIIVEAVDNGNQPHVVQTIVMVHIVDVGNNPPSIEINLLDSGTSKIKNIRESANPGTFVAHINVIDSDTGVNGQVDCEISDLKFELQTLKRGYKVVVKEKLDREAQHMHQITVTCHDYGTPSLSTSASFLVSLLDENDCAPVFVKNIFTGSIPENSRDFRTFTQIVAFDEDTEKNGEIRYYVDRESTPYRFWIDDIDGSLRADQVFDREKVSVIEFKVIARDLGVPSLSSKVTVKLTIEDENDNAPLIDKQTNFSVLENKIADSVVGSLHAMDLDEGRNGQFMFKIKPEFENNVPFVVFTDGIIKTNRQLDRETQSRYEFTVVVFDQGKLRLTSSANITVNVIDVNDNHPIVKFPKPRNNTVIVMSDANPGYKVTQIMAEDLDAGKNGISSYDITSGNDEDIFAIDNQLGGIYLTKMVPVTKNRTFQLNIAVKDGGEQQHITESKLNVVLVRAVNATNRISGDDNTNNTMIVVIVVVLTVVLSIVMIMIICFLRRFDHRSKGRKNLDIVAPDDKYPKCYMEDSSRYIENSNNTHDHMKLSYDPMSNVTCVKKKEVSFDIDDQLDRGDLRDAHNTTMSTFSVPESEKIQGLSVGEDGEESIPNSPQGRLNKIQLLQYHQAVLESQTRAWLQSQDGGNEEGSSFDVTLPDDKYSDTSEEVTASDSGKGGSEDDIPSNHSKELKTKSNGVNGNKFQTRHYVAPEFRRQGSLQRKACNINFEDIRVQSPTSPLNDDAHYRPDSRASITHSTPRPNSRAAVFYPYDQALNRTLDSTGQEHNGDWDTASYV
ncbi:hypothetical protein ACF0H5_010276 [Mactra antiquata]